MKVLLPISTEQIISIIPRKADVYLYNNYEDRVLSKGGVVENPTCVSSILRSYNDISMVIVMDGDKTKESLTDLKAVYNGNYIDIYFTSTILKEGFGYAIEMKQNDNLYYRDKLYATYQQDYKVKHNQYESSSFFAKYYSDRAIKDNGIVESLQCVDEALDLSSQYKQYNESDDNQYIIR